MSLENKYFAELARRLRAAGITAGHPEKNRLTVLLNNQPVLSVSAGSDVFLLPAGSNQPEAGELYHKVAQTADEVYAYPDTVDYGPLENNAEFLIYEGANVVGKGRVLGRTIPYKVKPQRK